MASQIAAAAATGAFATAHMALLTDMAGFSPGMSGADVTEADYNGYARKPIVWAGVSHTPEGRTAAHGGGLLFSPTDDLVPNTIIAAALFDALTAGNLLGIATFDEAVELPGPLADVSLVPVVMLPIPATSDNGEVAVVQ